MNHPPGDDAELDIRPLRQPLELCERMPGDAGRAVTGVQVIKEGNTQRGGERRGARWLGSPFDHVSMSSQWRLDPQVEDQMEVSGWIVGESRSRVNSAGLTFRELPVACLLVLILEHNWRKMDEDGTWK